MYYVYILESKIDSELYAGYSENLEKRAETHHAGLVKATRNRRHMQLIYYEAYIDKADAKGREEFLKSGSGHRFLKRQLTNYLSKRK